MHGYRQQSGRQRAVLVLVRLLVTEGPPSSGLLRRPCSGSGQGRPSWWGGSLPCEGRRPATAPLERVGGGGRRTFRSFRSEKRRRRRAGQLAEIDKLRLVKASTVPAGCTAPGYPPAF
eukprot:scaffold8647_cov40-Prasinocladus_malaysianus.AAC.1